MKERKLRFALIFVLAFALQVFMPVKVFAITYDIENYLSGTHTNLVLYPDDIYSGNRVEYRNGRVISRSASTIGSVLIDDVQVSTNVSSYTIPENKYYEIESIEMASNRNNRSTRTLNLKTLYLVNFDFNGGTGTETAGLIANGDSFEKLIAYGSTYYTDDNVISLPETSRNNFTFDGWYTDAIGGTEVTSDTEFDKSNDITLYAHWTANLPTDASYNVTTNYNYNGRTRTAVTGTNVTITGTNSATNAGTYTVYVTPEEGHAWSDGETDTKTIEWTISPAQINIPTLSNTEKTYNKNSQSPTVNGYNRNRMNQSGTNSATNAGTYTITWNLSDPNNYVWSDNTTDAKSATWNIAKAPVTVTIADKTSVYGENTVRLTSSVTAGTVYRNDNLRISLTKAAGVNAGEYAITGTYRNDNYDVTFIDGVYTITKAYYDMSAVTFEDDEITYDGEAHDLVIAGTLPEGVTVSYEDNGNVNVGEYEVTAAFTGDADNYYLIDSMTATLTINKAAVTVTIDDKTSVYGEDFVELTSVVTEGEVFGDDDLEITLTKEDGVVVGEYEITGTSTNDNYDVTFVDGVYTITKAYYDMNAVTFEGDEITYDGEAHDLVIAGSLPEGVTVSYEGNGNVNVGEYEVTAAFTGDADNYYLIDSMTATLTINKAAVTVTIDDKTSVYGEDFVELTSAVTEGEVFGSDDLEITLTKADGVNAGEYTITGMSTNDNYDVTFIDGVYTITKKQLSADEFDITIEKEYYIYTGSEIKPSIAVKTTDGLDIPEDEYLVTYKNNTDIGVASVIIGNNDGGNYIIEPSEITFNIVELGKIEIIESDEQNAYNAKIANTNDEIASKIYFAEEELAKLEIGKNIGIYVEVKDITDSVSEEDKKLIEEKLGDNTVGIYLEVNLFKVITGEEAIEITETTEPITISFEIPENLINNDSNVERTYKIIRIHNGVATEIDAEVNGTTITFKTDKFSTYALVYKDQINSTIPNTVDNIILYISMLVLSVIGLIATIIYTNKKRLN